MLASCFWWNWHFTIWKPCCLPVQGAACWMVHCHYRQETNKTFCSNLTSLWAQSVVPLCWWSAWSAGSGYCKHTGKHIAIYQLEGLCWPAGAHRRPVHAKAGKLCMDQQKCGGRGGRGVTGQGRTVVGPHYNVCLSLCTSWIQPWPGSSNLMRNSH